MKDNVSVTKQRRFFIQVNSQCQVESQLPTHILQTKLSISGLSVLLTADSVRRLQAKAGLPLANQVTGWILFGMSKRHITWRYRPLILYISVSSIALPLLSPFKSLTTSEKLLTLFITFVPCFVILAINAEGLFYASYCYMLVTWMGVEENVRNATAPARPNSQKGDIHELSSDGGSASNRQQYKPRWDDLRIALFFLFFVQVAFFGTGK